MRNLLPAAMIIGLALVLTPRSHAQSCSGACMWIVVSGTYYSNGNYVMMKADYDQSEDVTLYYDFSGFSAQVSDSLNTNIANPDASAPATWDIDSPPAGDTYTVDATVSATLDSQYDECVTSPCCYYPGCGFSGGGFTCEPIPCSGCPSGNMPGAVGDSESTSTSAPNCPQDTDGNATILAQEYWFPSDFGIKATPLWKPDPSCDGITKNLTPYLDEWAYSPSNPSGGQSVTDWGVFQQAMLTGLSDINTTTPPSSVSGIPGSPPTNAVPVYAEPGVVYRTPTYQYQEHGAMLDFSHDYGLGVDLSSTLNWTTLAAWAQWSNGSNPGSVKGNVCIEPQSESTAGHVHADWRTAIGLTCPTDDSNGKSWMPDYMSADTANGNTWPAH